jgi:hypothetical protein
VVPLKERVPLGCYTRHVECGEEHLAGLRCLLDAEELVEPIEPRQRVPGDIEGEEEKLVAVFSSVHDAVTGASGRCLGGWARCTSVDVAQLLRL